MPNPPDLTQTLRCPESKQRLKPAAAALIEKLNQQAVAGELKNHIGQPVTGKLDGGLIREDGKRLYLIRQDIPIMLVDESIEVD